MGTHPIFESDFDCLTDSRPPGSGIGRCSQMGTCFSDQPASRNHSTNHSNLYQTNNTIPYQARNSITPIQNFSTEDVSPGSVYIALYSYEGRTEDDLSFEQGDQIVVLDNTRGAWWLAELVTPKRVGRKKSGYIPSNYIAKLNSIESFPWYIGQLPRQTAERQLLTQLNQMGSFLIRESESRRGDFSLSVRDNDGVKHYRIRKLDGNSGYYIAHRAVFPTLDLLVQHYQNNSDGLCCQVSRSIAC